MTVAHVELYKHSEGAWKHEAQVTASVSIRWSAPGPIPAPCTAARVMAGSIREQKRRKGPRYTVAGPWEILGRLEAILRES